MEHIKIKSLLLSEAKRQRFWIACRMVMADIHETTLKDFPKTPSMDSISTMQQAVEASQARRCISAVQKHHGL